jgi:Mn-dependent DtxR family transcriptional regulator
LSVVVTKPGPDKQVSDRAILVAVRDLYGPAVGTSEVAEEVGVSRQTADKHLRRLESDGLVNSRMVGQVRVWWLDDDGERYLADRG